MNRLSNFETQLRLVLRDMIRVLNLPTEADTDTAPARQSVKRRTAPVEPKPVTFPAMPLDSVCADDMMAIAKATKWKPVKSHETAYFCNHFPQADFDL